jgi:hypothetical protein
MAFLRNLVHKNPPDPWRARMKIDSQLGSFCIQRHFLVALLVDEIQQVNGGARIAESAMMVVELDPVDFT